MIELNVTMNIAIFDLDDCLIHEGFDPPVVCDETTVVLDYLHSNKVICVLASYNNEASRLLQESNLLCYFSHVREDDDAGDAKYQQLTYYRSLFPTATLHFFDDLPSNIATARILGIHSTLVDYRYGIRLQEVRAVFES